MEADSSSKRAYSQVCTLRSSPVNCRQLDRALERLRPAEALDGPKIVKYNSKTLYDGHDRKMNWAPLEYY